MTVQSLQLDSVLAGFLLFLVLMLLATLLMIYAGKPILRRVADWLLNRRGFEKLGRPIRVRPENTPYENWLVNAKSEIPLHTCLYIDNVKTIRLAPWEQLGKGIRGLYLRLADYQFTDGRILEIPPMGSTNPARHLFEMAVCFLGGPGHTVIHSDGKPPRRIDWSHRSIYSIPINSRYQHFSDCEEPVRLLAMTSFPFVLNSTNNEDFIFNNSFEFNDRFGKKDKPNAQDDRMPANLEFLDFVPDALKVRLKDHSVRGKGTRNMCWTMSGNSMLSISVSEMAGRTIKRAHRSNSEASVLMLSGEGYALAWPEGAWHKRIRVNWHEGTLMAQPVFWYRQFMNLGASSARNLTASTSSLVANLGLRFLDQLENDLPGVRKEWVIELKARSKTENDSLLMP